MIEDNNSTQLEEIEVLVLEYIIREITIARLHSVSAVEESEGKTLILIQTNLFNDSKLNYGETWVIK